VILSLQTKLILIGIAVLAISGGILYWNLHEQHKGAAKCEQADTKAADTQIAQQAKQLATYKTQLEAADARHAQDLQLIQLAADRTPDTQLMCHETAARPVSRVPAPASSQPPAPGNADEVPGPGFDPRPAVHGLSVAFERRVEPARDALNRWPK